MDSATEPPEGCGATHTPCDDPDDGDGPDDEREDGRNRERTGEGGGATAQSVPVRA
jgi:hypothetical protein